MSVPICEHLKSNGVRCGSPAIRGTRYCFYHLGARHCLMYPSAMIFERSPNLPDLPPMGEFPIPFLDDPAALQIAYMQALYAITSKRLDTRRSRLVLDALNGRSQKYAQGERLSHDGRTQPRIVVLGIVSAKCREIRMSCNRETPGPPAEAGSQHPK